MDRMTGYQGPRAPSAGWDDERVEKLKALWLDGLSASQIAKRLGGVTRNAVIGKVHRVGLTVTDGAHRQPASAPSKLAKPPSPPKPKAAAKPTPPPLAVVEPRDPGSRKPWVKIPDSVFNEPGGRHWLTRDFGECAWPFGEGEAMRSCCAPVDIGPDGKVVSPYCAKHGAIAYLPRSQGQKKSDAKFIRWAARTA